MGNGKLVVDRAGVRRLLYSEGVKQAISQVAMSKARNMGSGYGVDTFNGFDRVHAIIKPGTKEAAEDNMQNNTMLKGVGR